MKNKKKFDLYDFRIHINNIFSKDHNYMIYTDLLTLYNNLRIFLTDGHSIKDHSVHLLYDFDNLSLLFYNDRTDYNINIIISFNNIIKNCPDPNTFKKYIFMKIKYHLKKI